MDLVTVLDRTLINYDELFDLDLERGDYNPAFDTYVFDLDTLGDDYTTLFLECDYLWRWVLCVNDDVVETEFMFETPEEALEDFKAEVDSTF